MRTIQLTIMAVVAIFIMLAGWVITDQFTIKKQGLISRFPIEHYDQDISHWIKLSDKDYNQALLSPLQQKMRQDELYAKYFGERSPWSADYMKQILRSGDNLQADELAKIHAFDNSDKGEADLQYGSNFIPHTSGWLGRIRENMNLQQFKNNHFDPERRGITTDNLQGRVLPTHDASFNSHKLAGQGYPFDNLQEVMIWAGTPVYILGMTHDHSWSLVQAPDFIAWVKSNGIAIADDHFVRAWQRQAQKNMAAITRTKIAMMDGTSQTYRFTGYIGMLFPAIDHATGIRIAIPVADSNGHAKIHYAQLSHRQAVMMPLLPTPHHFAHIMQQLINRPYGWGGMHAYSDCSSELRNLFIPFGILLPDHSSNQVDPESFTVRQVDLSQANTDERMQYLAREGHKFMTIVYIGGHVFLYLGNYTHPDYPGKSIILTYQDMWGLKPKVTDTVPDRRAIIGKSVLFPLLKVYPEDSTLASQASKAYFKLGYLD